ncbi:hypothetical protein IWZ01DRAFT_337117 [Phyllosticta capitalensis]
MNAARIFEIRCLNAPSMEPRVGVFVNFQAGVGGARMLPVRVFSDLVVERVDLGCPHFKSRCVYTRSIQAPCYLRTSPFGLAKGQLLRALMHSHATVFPTGPQSPREQKQEAFDHANHGIFHEASIPLSRSRSSRLKLNTKLPHLLSAEGAMRRAIRQHNNSVVSIAPSAAKVMVPTTSRALSGLEPLKEVWIFCALPVSSLVRS